MLTVFTQRNFLADLLKQSAILYGKRPFCVFEPFFGGLGATYLRLIGKRVVDFLLGVTAGEALRASV